MCSLTQGVFDRAGDRVCVSDDSDPVDDEVLLELDFVELEPLEPPLLLPPSMVAPTAAPATKESRHVTMNNPIIKRFTVRKRLCSLSKSCWSIAFVLSIMHGIGAAIGIGIGIGMV